MKSEAKAITLRNLPPELALTVQRKAAKERTSVNKAVIGLLEQGMGRRAEKRQKRPYHDLDFLAGAWSRRRAAEFDRTLKRQRSVDHELWK